MEKTYKQYEYFLWPAISAAVSILILGLVIIPQILSYLTTTEEINLTTDSILALEAKASQLQQLNEEKYKKDLGVIFRVLPIDSNVPAAVADIQAVIRQSNLSYKGVNYLGSSEKDKNKFILTFQGSGNLNNLRSFINNLKKSSGVYQIESLNVSFKKERLTYDFNIPISVFYESITHVKLEPNSPAPKLSEAEESKLAEISRLVPESVASSSQTQSQTPATAPVPQGKSDPFE